MTGSLRARLLLGILAPVLLIILVNSVSLYRQSLAAATTAYDRTLLASAKTIGEQLEVEGFDGAATTAERAGRAAWSKDDDAFFDRGPGYASLADGAAFAEVDRV